MIAIKDRVLAAYGELLDHVGCLDCRARRDKDGRSTGMCPEGDRLALAHRRAKKQARQASCR